MGDGPRFRQAGIPTELADEIDAFIARNAWLGHRTLSRFVTEASRRMLAEERGQEFRRRVLQDDAFRDGLGDALARDGAEPRPAR